MRRLFGDDEAGETGDSVGDEGAKRVGAGCDLILGLGKKDEEDGQDNEDGREAIGPDELGHNERSFGVSPQDNAGGEDGADGAGDEGPAIVEQHKEEANHETRAELEEDIPSVHLGDDKVRGDIVVVEDIIEEKGL